MSSRRSRRLLLAMTAAACIAGLLPAAPANAEVPYPLNGCPNLVRGASGQCVEFLQQELNYYGFGLAVDGQFGGNTYNAVVAFQQKAGIGVDGQAGPQTQAVLERDNQGVDMNCSAIMLHQSRYQGGPENDFGAALDLFIVVPPIAGPCTGWVERSVNGGAWTRISQIYTIDPIHGGEAISPYEWDGTGAEDRVCVQSDGNVQCSATPF